jgi:hypothetical protein
VEKLLTTSFWELPELLHLKSKRYVRTIAPFVDSIYSNMPFRKITFGEANAKEKRKKAD